MNQIIIDRINHSLKTYTLKELITWVKQTAELTKNKSGMFGCDFPKLISYLESIN